MSNNQVYHIFQNTVIELALLQNISKLYINRPGRSGTNPLIIFILRLITLSKKDYWNKDLLAKLEVAILVL